MDKRNNTAYTYHTIKSLRAARAQIREEIDLAKAELFIVFFAKRKEDESMSENAFETWVNRIKIVLLAYNSIKNLREWYRKNCQ